MKTSRLLILVAALMVGAAFAAGAQAATPAAPMLGQPGSLVEVYGVIDMALRGADNANPDGGTIFGFSQGLFNGSRVGFRGTEGLGGSFKAIYALETGVIVPVGTLDQQGQIFGRQAWVGVNSDYGKLAFGRQYGEFSDAIGVGDVFGVNHGNQPYVSATNYGSNDAVNAFFLQESALRWDDSIKYDANFGGVTVGAMAYLSSISGSALPGAVNQNAMYSGSLGYNSKDFPVSAAVGVQWELDANQHNHYDVGGGVKWAFDSTDAVYAFYFYSQYDSGFARINANNSEFSSGLANGRTDNILGVAANYYVTQSLNLIAAYYLDYAQNVLNTIDNGTRNSILVVADYYFTKDFDTYLAASYSMFSGDLENTANGGDAFDANPANSITDVTSVVMGMRFRF